MKLSNWVRRTAFFVVLGSLAACGSSKKPAGGSGAVSDAAADGNTGPKYPACKSPTARLDSNHQDSGYVICDGNGLHRGQKTACVSTLPRSTTCGPPIDSGAFNLSCHSDAECMTKPYGYCGSSARIATCFCQYGCTTDADCGPGNVCLCGTPAGQCVPADCTSDADCGGGALCIQTSDGACGFKFTCQKPGDLCLDDGDCAAIPGAACTLENGNHVCKPSALCEVQGI